jgi:hypothetical protein
VSMLSHIFPSVRESDRRSRAWHAHSDSENIGGAVHFAKGGNMRSILMQIIVAVPLAVVSTGSARVLAAEQTWTGKISDSLCGASHQVMASQANLSDQQCTLECVKAGGKYIFVGPNDKVFQITNQDFAGLAQHPSETVVLTGELKGDTITVSKVEVPASSK